MGRCVSMTKIMNIVAQKADSAGRHLLDHEAPDQHHHRQQVVQTRLERGPVSGSSKTGALGSSSSSSGWREPTHSRPT
jgi:hypothetical protein